jgi:hypothetical protein
MLVIVGLAAGNFIYQMFMAEPNFLVAFERSFFQAIAVFAYIIASKV